MTEPTRLRARAAAHAAPAAVPDHGLFPALDGMRAVAVAMVVATHAAFWTGGYQNSAFKAPLARLDAGVAIFFVLSGFLLVRPWLQAARDNGPLPSLRVYFWRRALRILPLYWLTIALAFFGVDQVRPITAADWVRHLLLVQTGKFSWLRPGLTHTWSLSTEAAFYVTLPLFGIAAVLWCRRRGWQPRALLLLSAALALVSVWWPYAIHGVRYTSDWTPNLWLPAYLSWFVGGMVLALVQVHAAGSSMSSRSRRWLDALRAAPGILVVVATAVWVMSCSPIAGPLGLSTVDQTTSAAVRSTLYAVAAVTLVFPAVFSPQSLLHRFLAHPVMRRLGEVSYGVFLLHIVLLEWLMWLFGWPLFTGNTLYLFAATMVVSTAAAELSFRFIEAPARRLRRLVKGPSRRRE